MSSGARHLVQDGLVVEVVGGDVEGALAALKKRMTRNGTMKEIRRRARYTKPSEAARQKSARARRRARRMARRGV